MGRPEKKMENVLCELVALPAIEPFATLVYEYVVKEVYAKNFRVGQTQKIQAFFKEHGYVIIRDVIPHIQCAATRKEIQTSIQTKIKSEFNMYDTKTHDCPQTFNNYGMWSDPLFGLEMMRNRCNKKLARAFAVVYGCSEQELIINHDSGCFYRPTQPHHADRATFSCFPDLHVDFHPGGYLEQKQIQAKRNQITYHHIRNWMLENNLLCRNDGLQLAGVINLYPNRRQDGGFHCADKFMHNFDAWLSEQKDKFQKPEIGSYEFDKRDKTDMKYLTPCEFVRASAPAGALIIWNQLTAHGSQPNDSDRFRCGQFVKVFKKSSFTAQRLERRKKEILRLCPPLVSIFSDHRSFPALLF